MSRSRTRFRFDLDRTRRWHSATCTGALAATPHNSRRHPYSAVAAAIVIIAESATGLHDRRREHYEQRRQSVRAVRGRSPRSQRVRAAAAVGGTQLDVCNESPKLQPRHPRLCCAPALWMGVDPLIRHTFEALFMPSRGQFRLPGWRTRSQHVPRTRG
jgi:hypothetical protein